MVTIVKRRGRKEKFDERKLYASVYAACTSMHLGEMECEQIASNTAKKIKTWLKGKKQIDSGKIRERVGTELKKRSKELHFFYEEHLPNLKNL